MLEAIREVDPAIRFYQASSSEIFGEPVETPQNEATPLAPLTPYGVAKAYGHFISSSYRRRYGLFACCGILYNHESPRRPLDFLPAQGGALRRRDLARARARARARRPRLAPRLGVREGLRPRDVADAAAGRAGRLRRRDRREPLGAGARRAGVRARRARLAGARPQRPGAPAWGCGAAPPRRGSEPGAGSASGGSRASISTGSSALLVDAELERLRLSGERARRSGRARGPSRPT